MRAQDKMGKRFAIVIGVAAAGVMALGAQTATAAPDVVKYDTELTITKDRSDHYWGTVISEVRECMGGRRVILFKQRPGADRKLGTDRSEFRPRGEGIWHERPGRKFNDVYAKVTPKVGDGLVCRADRSPTIKRSSHPRS